MNIALCSKIPVVRQSLGLFQRWSFIRGILSEENDRQNRLKNYQPHFNKGVVLVFVVLLMVEFYFIHEKVILTSG